MYKFRKENQIRRDVRLANYFRTLPSRFKLALCALEPKAAANNGKISELYNTLVTKSASMGLTVPFCGE